MKFVLWDLTIFGVERVPWQQRSPQGDNDFITVASVADPNQPAVPCGACRQVLAEFNAAIKIIASTDPEDRSLS